MSNAWAILGTSNAENESSVKRAEELRGSAREGEQIGTNAKNDKVMLTDG